MFRLRQASGEEAVFRSVDELALGLRSGIIGAETDVLDGPDQEWRPLSSHPVFPQVQAIASTLVSPGSLDFEPSYATTPVTITGEHGTPTPSQPVLQMFSRSAAELRAKRRPKILIKSAIVGGAILVVVATAAVMWREQQDHTDLRTMGTPPAASSLAGAQAGNAVGGGIWISPAILASRRDGVRARLDQGLIDSIGALRLRGLLDLAVLQSPDSVRVGRQHISESRRLIEAYRNGQRSLARAYEDTADGQVRSTRWSPLDANDWKSRRPAGEPAPDAIRSDSLLAALEGLYQLLLTQQGTYVFTADSAQFSAWRVAVEYERLRGIITRHRTAATAPGSDASLPLNLLLRGLEGPRLPAVPVPVD